MSDIPPFYAYINKYTMEDWLKIMDNNEKSNSNLLEKECKAIGIFLLTEEWDVLSSLEIETIILYLIKLDVKKKLKKQYSYLKFIFSGKDLEKYKNSTIFFNLTFRIFNDIALEPFYQFIFRYVFKSLFKEKWYTKKRPQRVNDMLLDVYLGGISKCSSDQLENKIYCFKNIFYYVTNLLFKNFENYNDKNRFRDRFMIPILETLRKGYRIKNYKDYLKLAKIYSSILKHVEKTDFKQKNSIYLKEYITSFGEIFIQKFSDINKNESFNWDGRKSKIILSNMEELLFGTIKYPIEIKYVFCNLFNEFLKGKWELEENLPGRIIVYYLSISASLTNDKIEFWLIFIPLMKYLMVNNSFLESRLVSALNVLWTMIIQISHFSSSSTQLENNANFAFLQLFTFFSWSNIHVFINMNNLKKTLNRDKKSRKIILRHFYKKFGSCKILRLQSIIMFFFVDMYGTVDKYQMSILPPLADYMSVYTNFIDLLSAKTQNLMENNKNVIFDETETNHIWKFNEEEFSNSKLANMIGKFLDEIVYQSNKTIREHLIFI